MPKNRLKLNFQLESAEDRAKFIQEYLPSLNFQPNEYELETISNYILWGKDSKGQNAQQAGFVEIKKWTADPVESLDALIETPGFTETSVRPLKEPPARVQRTTFDRTKALQNAPDYLVDAYNELFRQIDEIELELNYYELFCGRRKLPPREGLISKFTEEEQRILNEKAIHLTQYKYLKLRHLLVELRSQQYTYSDNFTNRIYSHTASLIPVLFSETLYVGDSIGAYPLGLKHSSTLSQKMYPDGRFPAPGDFTDGELQEISKLLWQEMPDIYLDFTNEKHILCMYQLRADLRDQQMEDPSDIYGTAVQILNTLQYYEDRAQLEPLQKELLELKLNNIANYDIASQLNKKYNKSYNENYISTIFHQKIIPQVADAARQHREVVENIFYPENFKKCRDCGRVLLMTSDNFVRQKKSSDGFSPRCKRCEKLKRSRYK